MNVSLRWLEDFLRRRLDVKDVTERLAMLGAPVDGVEPLHAGLGDVLIGLVEEVRPHPNADRLRVCLVNDGTAERRNVVCGAANVAAGRKYPFAPVGATLPGGLRIEKRKLRGEASEGMLCSARELGLGQDGDGIWELGTEAAPGTRLLEAVPLEDRPGDFPETREAVVERQKERACRPSSVPAPGQQLVEAERPPALARQRGHDVHERSRSHGHGRPDLGDVVERENRQTPGDGLGAFGAGHGAARRVSRACSTISK